MESGLDMYDFRERMSLRIEPEETIGVRVRVTNGRLGLGLELGSDRIGFELGSAASLSAATRRASVRTRITFCLPWL